MDDVQKQHERAIGDDFINWFNSQNESNFSFSSRGDPAPDIIYKDKNRILKIEVVGSYYDENDAELKWKIARRRPDTPKRWAGVNFDEDLLRNINGAIEEKCSKSYGAKCILLVYISPPLTTDNEVEDMLPRVDIPKQVPFAAIYLTGIFGRSKNSTGGYRVWPLYINRDALWNILGAAI